jgi:hypothetical protein
MAEMTNFTGRLQGERLEPSSVTIEIDEDRLRITVGRSHLGSWPLQNIRAERTSIYRFALTIDGDRFEFLPDDPTEFSNVVGAVVDLSESSGRFGLKARIEQVANG